MPLAKARRGHARAAAGSRMALRRLVLSEREHERNQVRLFLRAKVQLQHEVEELDRVFARKQPAIVEVGRRLLDAAQRAVLNGPSKPSASMPPIMRGSKKRSSPRSCMLLSVKYGR